ncbi:MAG: hypothetical protein GF350_06075 [Chitinivibrionales bacterium]|nr:hypothetical protein [Chitinivibrionales bacterium]
MKVSRRSISKGIVTAGSLMLITLTGCLFSPRNPVSTEAAKFFAGEVAGASAASDDIIAGGPAKSLAVLSDTIKADLTVVPYSYDEAVGGYVRQASFTTSEGYERTRRDTVIFKDASAATLQYPTMATLSSIEHVRRVVHSNGGPQADIRINTTMELTKGADTTGVWNGSLTGTYDNEQVATGTIDNVTRIYTNGHWQFLSSGTIETDFPNRAYRIEYSGNNQAMAWITNKRRDRVTEVSISVDPE